MVETSSTLSNNLHSYYFKRLLESAEKQLKIVQLGKKLLHPRRTGKDSYLLKYGNISNSVAVLSEGVTPTASTIDTNKYTMSINQYGKYISVSDLLLMTAIDPVLEEISDRLGYDAALTADSVVRNVVLAGATTHIDYVGAGNTVDNDIAANEIFTAQDIIKSVRKLKIEDSPAFDDGMYRWVVHPGIAVDIMADTSAGGFIELNKYVAGMAEKPLKGEIGRVYGARVIESSNISSAVNTSTVNVYKSILFGKDSFAFTSFDSDFISMKVKQVGSSGSSDPLDQIGTAGYKMEFGCTYIGGTFTNENGASPDLAAQLRGAITGG